LGKTLQKSFSHADVKILSEKTCYSGFLQIKQFQIKCRLYQGGWSESENIRSNIIDRASAEDAVKKGQINNAMSIIAIQWLSLNLNKLRG